MGSGVLDGLRVLDFGRYIAGPYCAALLGDLGAEVVRVERREGSEDRFLVPVTPDGSGGIFMQCNRGKLGLTLDPVTPEGREVTRRLVRTADVVVANLPPRALESMGLDYASLVAEKPGIILTMVTAFGSSGPYADRVGFDGIGQAMSGAMYLSGTPDAPVKCSVNYVDFTTAISAALGTVAALLERQKTGRGQIVDASLFGTALTLMNAALIEQAVLGVGRVGTGNRSQNSGPSDTFRTTDGWVLVQVVGQPLFERWVRLMGEPPWLEDPRYSTDAARGQNGAALSDRTQAWCGARTTEEALAALEAARIPAGPVNAPAQTLEDPHLQQGSFFESSHYPGQARPIPVARAPFGLGGGGAAVHGRAPTLGEHTDRILRSLGYSAADIAGLRERGAV